MREAARILLDLIRYANRNHIDLGAVLPTLVKTLGISEEETMEIGEILKADVRELNATYPAYEGIKARLEKMSPDNPRGL